MDDSLNKNNCFLTNSSENSNLNQILLNALLKIFRMKFTQTFYRRIKAVCLLTLFYFNIYGQIGSEPPPPPPPPGIKFKEEGILIKDIPTKTGSKNLMVKELRGYYGLYDEEKSRWLIPLKYEYLIKLDDDQYLASNNKTCGVINKKEQIIQPFILNPPGYNTIDIYLNKYIIVRMRNKCGLYSIQERKIKFDCKYNNITFDPKSETFLLRKDEKSMLLDKDLKKLFKNDYSGIDIISENVFKVTNYATIDLVDKNENKIISKNGKIIEISRNNKYVVFSDGKTTSILDIKGNFICDLQDNYYELFNYNSNVEDVTRIVTHNKNKKGFAVVKDNRLIKYIEPNFDSIYFEWPNAILLTSIDHSYALINDTVLFPNIRKVREIVNSQGNFVGNLLQGNSVNDYVIDKNCKVLLAAKNIKVFFSQEKFYDETPSAFPFLFSGLNESGKLFFADKNIKIKESEFINHDIVWINRHLICIVDKNNNKMGLIRRYDFNEIWLDVAYDNIIELKYGVLVEKDGRHKFLDYDYPNRSKNFESIENYHSILLEGYKEYKILSYEKYFGIYKFDTKEWIVPLIYDKIEPIKHNEFTGFKIVKNGLEGLLDRNFKTLFNAEYTKISFNDDLVIASKGCEDNVFLLNNFELIRGVSNVHSLNKECKEVSCFNGKYKNAYSNIMCHGKLMLTNLFNNIKLIKNVGYYCMENDSFIEVYDFNFKPLIDKKDKILLLNTLFDNSIYFIARKNDKLGIISFMNETIVPFEYDIFKEAKIGRNYLGRKGNKYCLISYDENKIPVIVEEGIFDTIVYDELIYAYKVKGKFYLKNYKKELVGIFDNILNIKNVWLGPEYGEKKRYNIATVKQNNMVYNIDQNGIAMSKEYKSLQEIPAFDNEKYESYNFCLYKYGNGGKVMGVIDCHDEIIIEPGQFDNILWRQQNYIVVTKNGKQGLFDTKLRKLVAKCEFDFLSIDKYSYKPVFFGITNNNCTQIKLD